MKEPFFIFGTARTRTTWFANLFTYTDVFCYNEESRYMRHLDEIQERIDERPENMVGFSDPELFHYIEYIWDRFPTAKYVLLERDREESIKSLADIAGCHPEQLEPKFKLWDKNIQFAKENIPHLKTIHFDEMDKKKKVHEIWNYIVPSDLDIGRYHQLNSMIIKGTAGNKPVPPKSNCLAPYFDYGRTNFQP